MTDLTTPAAVVLTVTDATYSDVVLNAREPILVAFMTDTDSTCRPLRPILADLARERAGRLVVATVDVATNPAIAHSWGITQVPVMLLLYRGVLQRVLRGIRPYARLVQEIDEISIPQTRYTALLPRSA